MRKFKGKIEFCIKRTCFLAILAISIDASAAGFDCSKASTSIETMICNDGILSDLDSAMSNLYNSKKDDKLKEIQLGWIKNKRNLAHSSDELRVLYAEHIQFLSTYVDKTKNYDSENKSEGVSKPVESRKSIAKEKIGSDSLQLSDFENEFISIDDMEYSTGYQEMNKSNYVILCADAMMIDVMNSWRRSSAKKNQSREFSRLRKNIYNGLWNALVDDIESKVNTQDMRMVCDLLIAANR
ncbi:TPA: lysozyme inhibitor LprI family protein [Serratia marcescens]